MSLFRLSVLALPIAAGIGTAVAEPAGVAAPVMRPGDAWVFDKTIERGPATYSDRKLDLLVERVDGDEMIVGLKPDGAPTGFEDQILGVDWSHRRIVGAKEIATTRPLAFPLVINQRWTADFDDPQRRGPQVFAHNHKVYTVVGWEDVTVPAGTFHAIKIEMHGQIEARYVRPAVASSHIEASSEGSIASSLTAPSRAETHQFTTYGVFYYVPELKNWAKSVEEQYNGDGVRTERQTDTLVSYKLANSP